MGSFPDQWEKPSLPYMWGRGEDHITTYFHILTLLTTSDSEYSAAMLLLGLILHSILVAIISIHFRKFTFYTRAMGRLFEIASSAILSVTLPQKLQLHAHRRAQNPI